MGKPKKQRKHYESPFKRWDGARIEEEHKIVKSFGLKNKTEIAKVRHVLKKFRTEASRLFTRTDEVAEKEKVMLINRLYKLGLLEQDSSLDDVLGLTLDNLMSRRLQSFVYKKGLAHTPKQARQMISHGHIAVGDNIVTIPSFMVERLMESSIIFVDSSAFSNPDHPVRRLPKEDAKLLEKIKGEKKEPPKPNAEKKSSDAAGKPAAEEKVKQNGK